MSKLFGDAELTIPCGQCGHKTKQKVARLETNPKLTCPKCGVVTEYNADQFRAQLADADKAIEKLRKTFKDFGKR